MAHPVAPLGQERAVEIFERQSLGCQRIDDVYRALFGKKNDRHVIRMPEARVVKLYGLTAERYGHLIGVIDVGRHDRAEQSIAEA